jgi:hypothetical protein
MTVNNEATIHVNKWHTTLVLDEKKKKEKRKEKLQRHK